MLALLQNLNFIIAFICALLALHIIKATPTDRVPSLLLGVSFIILALQALLMNVIAVYGRDNVAGILLPCFALLIGPLFYLTFQYAAKHFSRLSLVHTLHALPAIGTALMLTSKRVWLDIDLVIIISFLSYTALLLRMVFIGETQFAHLNHHRRISFQWLMSASAIMVLALVSELLVLNELLLGYALKGSTTLLVASLIKLLSLGFVLYFTLQSPALFEWIVQFGNTITSPRVNQEHQQRLKAVASDFLNLVDSERIFANDDVSLKSVAQRLGIPARLLSEAINFEFKQSFSKYLNVRRVAEARKLLETSDLSITQLMYEAGFRTKSNFNKEFRAIEGMSPSDYRDSLRT